MILLTGATGGIGVATARELARRGARLVLSGRREDRLRDIASAITAAGGEAVGLPADVTDRAAVGRLVDASLERYGRIDILIANAGELVLGTLPDLRLDRLEHAMAVNFYGSVAPALDVLPGMIERQSGHLVFVTSMAGRKGVPTHAPYVASKHAITGFADTARQELRPLGIAVTTILPGRVDTALIRDHGLLFHRISRPISPERVAHAIVGALHRRPAEVIIPGHIRALQWAGAVWPGLADWGVRRFRLEGWREEEPR